MGFKDSIRQFYETKYKALLLITLLLIPVALGVLIVSKFTTGEFFQKGVSLKGGDTYTFPVAEEFSLEELQAWLGNAHPDADITVRGVSEFGRLTAIIVEAAYIDEQALVSSLQEKGIDTKPGAYSRESIGASLGATFY